MVDNATQIISIDNLYKKLNTVYNFNTSSLKVHMQNNCNINKRLPYFINTIKHQSNLYHQDHQDYYNYYYY